jgi:3-oxoacyl-[acyl-carrier protein] reductase
MNDTDFTSKTVLVVGGSSGIGNGIAQGFRARGAAVHVWGTRQAAAEYMPADGSDLDGLHYKRVDVAVPDEIDATADAFTALDVLVLSQGIVVHGGGEYERAQWDQVVAINLGSVMQCCTRFRPLLAASRGAIVIVSSVSGVKAHAGLPAYGASKAGAISLTKSLGLAWASEGIRVNGIAPGFVETKLTAVATADPKRHAAMLARIPVGRAGTPGDMAGAAIFLASPLASYIVGHTMMVDGGLTL